MLPEGNECLAECGGSAPIAGSGRAYKSVFAKRPLRRDAHRARVLLMGNEEWRRKRRAAARRGRAPAMNGCYRARREGGPPTSEPREEPLQVLQLDRRAGGLAQTPTQLLQDLTRPLYVDLVGDLDARRGIGAIGPLRRPAHR